MTLIANFTSKSVFEEQGIGLLDAIFLQTQAFCDAYYASKLFSAGALPLGERHKLHHAPKSAEEGNTSPPYAPSPRGLRPLDLGVFSASLLSPLRIPDYATKRYTHP